MRNETDGSETENIVLLMELVFHTTSQLRVRTNTCSYSVQMKCIFKLLNPV